MIGIERSSRGDETKKAAEKEPPRPRPHDARSLDRRAVDGDVRMESACRGWGIVDALWSE